MGIATLFLLSLTVVWVDRLRFLKKKLFSSLRSFYHKLAIGKKLILPLEKYFKTLNNIRALPAQSFWSHLQFFEVGEIMVSKYGYLMLPGEFPDIESYP